MLVVSGTQLIKILPQNVTKVSEPGQISVEDRRVVDAAHYCATAKANKKRVTFTGKQNQAVSGSDSDSESDSGVSSPSPAKKSSTKSESAISNAEDAVLSSPPKKKRPAKKTKLVFADPASNDDCNILSTPKRPKASPTPAAANAVVSFAPEDFRLLQQIISDRRRADFAPEQQPPQQSQ